MARFAATVDLPTPPFAAGNGDHVLDAGNACRSGRGGLRRSLDIDEHARFRRSWNRTESGLPLVFDRLGNRRLIRGEGEQDFDVAAVDFDIFQQAE